MPPKDEKLEGDAEQELISTDRAASYPARREADLRQASSVFASGNKTRDDQPSHIRIEARVPGRGADVVTAHPAHVYEIGEEDAGKVAVQVTPSNCVQCGAITAKGGRLTRPRAARAPATQT
jgi:electron-transferring-flavoprotein dehydrogenase